MFMCEKFNGVNPCNKIFQSARTLQSHICSKHEDKFVVTCGFVTDNNRCTKMFQTELSYNLHVTIIHGKTPTLHQCDKVIEDIKCGRIFPTKKELKQHQKVSHRPKNFICELQWKNGQQCNRKFASQEDLDDHIAENRDRKRKTGAITCDFVQDGVVCGKTFKNQHRYMHHRNLNHLNAVICPKLQNGKPCQKSCKVISELEDHIRVWHTPVRCPKCDENVKPFDDLTLLIEHQTKENHFPYFYCKNQWCGYTTTEVDKKVKHEMNCIPKEERIKCSEPYCLRTYAKEFAYRGHLFKDHKLKKEEVMVYLRKSGVLDDGVDKKYYWDAKARKEEDKWKTSILSATKAITKGLADRNAILDYGRFKICYNKRTYGPKWTYEILTPSYLKISTIESKPGVTYDYTIPENHRISSLLYRTQGYDRGHMVAAINHRGDLATWKNTFLISNMLPQLEDFNRGFWNKLEERVYEFAKIHAVTFVLTGPIYDGYDFVELKTLEKIPIPSAFFKIVVGVLHNSFNLNVISYKIPHKNIDENEDFSLHYSDLSILDEELKQILFPAESGTKIKYVNGKIVKDYPQIEFGSCVYGIDRTLLMSLN